MQTIVLIVLIIGLIDAVVMGACCAIDEVKEEEDENYRKGET